MSNGPWYWDDAGGTPAFGGGLWLNGHLMEGGRGFPIGMVSRGPVNLLPMAGDTDVAQSMYMGGDQPLNLKPETFDLKMVVRDEADYWSVQEAMHFGRPVDLWFDWPWVDVWWVPGAEAAQVTWRSGRKFPYGLVTSIDHTARPPRVWTVTSADVRAELTVIKTGTPATGEVKVPEASGYQDIETFTDVVGTSFEYLIMRYHPMFLVVVDSLGNEVVEYNKISFDVKIKEQRGGNYVPATGA